ncbi:MAG: ribbon-helix-helix protein, CopG family [Proteobacteria bacterium]|nr:ribbon-helix-helix protein, CopG family [Pseudomonadota bacterium]
MAVSVRMDPLLEKELEQAARRQGVTKSQFIIAAVERALGRKDPAQLYRQIMEEAAQYRVSEGVADADLPAHQGALRESLRERYAQQQDDYAAYLAQRGKP